MPVTLIAASMGITAAGDWPEFRGPSGQGVSDEVGIPVTWSETENIAWKVAVPGTGWSSPVIAGGRVFLTTAVPQRNDGRPGHSLRVLCLDADSGRIVWNVEAFHQPDGPQVQMHKKNSHASPTPMVDGEWLYVHFGPHGTACLRTDDGQPVWKNDEIDYAPTHGTGGSPALAGERLVICCDGSNRQFVVGLDKRSGDIVWKTERDLDALKGFSFSTPLIIDVAGRQQAICPASGAVYAYDPQTGHELWRVQYGDGYSVVPRPVFGHGLVFVCTGYEDPQLLAIDPTGTGDVTDTLVRWTLTRGVPHTSSPLVVGDELYVVDDRGIATCVDARTGEVHWQERLGGKYSASPLYADGNVYFQDETGTATVVRAATAFDALARNRLSGNERSFASYAIHRGSLFLRSEGHLYRIEKRPDR
jgi:outer membrane protein assembly factor BamB